MRTSTLASSSRVVTSSDHVHLIELKEKGTCRDCIDPDRFFFEGTPEELEFAKTVFCSVCPMLSLCRTYALENLIDYGVWGGMTADERAPLLEVQRITRGLQNHVEDAQQAFEKIRALFQPLGLE